MPTWISRKSLALPVFLGLTVPCFGEIGVSFADARARQDQDSGKPTVVKDEAVVANPDERPLRVVEVSRPIGTPAQRRARAREDVNIVMYMNTRCGASRQARSYLIKHRIRYIEIDLDKDPSGRSTFQRLNPRGSLPTFDIDGHVLVGWQPAQFRKLVKTAAAERFVSGRTNGPKVIEIR
jgi:hypothetical protein